MSFQKYSSKQKNNHIATNPGDFFIKKEAVILLTAYKK